MDRRPRAGPHLRGAIRPGARAAGAESAVGHAEHAGPVSAALLAELPPLWARAPRLDQRHVRLLSLPWDGRAGQPRPAGAVSGAAAPPPPPRPPPARRSP